MSAKQTNFPLFYRNTGGLYWKIFTDYSPKFKKNGEVTVSSRETKLYFNTDNDLKISLALFGQIYIGGGIQPILMAEIIILLI